MILEQTEQSSPHLPEIHMVRHARAKRLKLAVSAQGVRLTVPPYATKRQVHDFLVQSQGWLEQTWQKQQLFISQKAEQSTQIELPTTLDLNFSTPSGTPPLEMNCTL